MFETNRSEIEDILGYDPDKFAGEVQNYTNQSQRDIFRQVKELYNDYPVVFNILGFVALVGLVAYLIGEGEDEGNHKLEINIYDVKHGNSIYISTPDGTQIIQDLGQGSYDKSSEYWSPLEHLRDKWDISGFDYTVVTHPDLDHIEDILNLDDFKIGKFIRPFHLSRDKVVDNVRDSDRDIFERYADLDTQLANVMSYDQKRLEISPAETGGAEIEFFRPKDCSDSNLNNHSIVTVIEYADTKIVLPGDNESASWRELLELDEFVEAIEDADVLLAAHHGREDGFCEDIFEEFNPKLTIVSDGEYGDTSVTKDYNRVTEGWEVHDSDGGSEPREVLTTRNDGYVRIEVGFNEENPYLEVKKGD